MKRLPLVVMYHYVWPDDEPAPGGIRPLRASEFEHQLDWLQERFEIVGPDGFLKSLNDGDWNEKPPCLLTFDDGTRDHAQVVTPILSRRGLGGLFFVLTWPIELSRMPLTHAVHWLLGANEQEVWCQLKRAVIEETGDIESLGDSAEAQRIYHYETTVRARIKYAFNMALAPELAERVMEKLMEESGESSAELARRWFASADQIVAMRDAGMTIGMHGCSHRSLQVLGAQEIREEINHSSAYLTSLLGEQPRWLACPFGGSGASVEAVNAMRDAMREFAVVGSVTTQKVLVPAGCDPWRLPRIDAIDLPPRREFSLERGSAA